MKIVFMGTPDFSVPCLDTLSNAGHEILAVFTQPDKPKGRGYVMTPPAVKVRAMELNIPVFQPKAVKDGKALEILKGLAPDVIVVVAYGKILPAEILSLPKYGCINIHASLLPRHRGASPIQWAIVCGDKETGVTTVQMDAGMDTGDMLLTARTSIDKDETAGELHDRLSVMGASLICETLSGLLAGEITPVKQDENKATKAPMIKKEMGLMDFNKPAQELHNLVRGFSEWPSAFTSLSGKRLKVLKTIVLPGKCEYPTGTVADYPGKLVVSCGGGTLLELLLVQLEGARRLPAEELLRGHRIEKGQTLGIIVT